MATDRNAKFRRWKSDRAVFQKEGVAPACWERDKAGYNLQC
jgi:hypothetical protein